MAEYRGISEGSVYAYVRDARRLRSQGKEGGIPFSQPRGTGPLRFKPGAVRDFFEDTGSGGDKEEIVTPIQQLTQIAVVVGERLVAIADKQIELTERVNTLTRDLAAFCYRIEQMAVVTNEQVQALAEQIRLLAERNGGSAK